MPYLLKLATSHDPQDRRDQGERAYFDFVKRRQGRYVQRNDGRGRRIVPVEVLTREAAYSALPCGKGICGKTQQGSGGEFGRLGCRNVRRDACCARLARSVADVRLVVVAVVTVASVQMAADISASPGPAQCSDRTKKIARLIALRLSYRGGLSAM